MIPVKACFHHECSKYWNGISYFYTDQFVLDGHDVEELRALEMKANVVKTMWKKKTFAKTSFKGLVLR